MQCDDTKRQNCLLESKLRTSLCSVMTQKDRKQTQNQFMQCDDKNTELVIGKANSELVHEV